MEGRGKVAFDPRDFEPGANESDTQPRLTLMEEVLLLGLKDKAVSQFNCSIILLSACPCASVPAGGEARRRKSKSTGRRERQTTRCQEQYAKPQGYLSFWNDNISYALRGCILIELALRRRIAMVRDPSRRRLALADRLIEVIDDRQTGETILDEALKMMKSSEKYGAGAWVDLMSGELSIFLPYASFHLLPTCISPMWLGRSYSGI